MCWLLSFPVDITYFKSRSEGGQTALEWETAWEKHSSEFVIERSDDMKNFTAIGTLAASGETTRRTSYAFIDNNPPAGISYYRLKTRRSGRALHHLQTDFSFQPRISGQNPGFPQSCHPANHQPDRTRQPRRGTVPAHIMGNTCPVQARRGRPRVHSSYPYTCARF